jgi:hypothetical protein
MLIMGTQVSNELTKALETSIIPDLLSGLFLFFWDLFVSLVLRQPLVLAVLSSARCIILLFSNICEIPGEIVVVQCCLLLFQSIEYLFVEALDSITCSMIY